MSEWKEDCSNCGHRMIIDGDDLSNHACDTSDFECVECGVIYDLEWWAEIELTTKTEPPKE